jgi:hypothetical protein
MVQTISISGFDMPTPKGSHNSLPKKIAGFDPFRVEFFVA